GWRGGGGGAARRERSARRLPAPGRRHSAWKRLPCGRAEQQRPSPTSIGSAGGRPPGAEAFVQSDRYYWLASDWPMISWAVKLMPQVGNALPTKKLSDWAE